LLTKLSMCLPRLMESWPY
jgi:hypothetical protein